MTLRNGDAKGKVFFDVSAGTDTERGFTVIHRSQLALVAVQPSATIRYQHVGEDCDRCLNIGSMYPESRPTRGRVREAPRRAERIARVTALVKDIESSILDEDQDVIWTYDPSGEWTRIPDAT